jgi:ribosome recycling factor
MKAKSFDAVKFMRERRDELSRKYSKNPETQKEELSQIRRKYNAFKHIAAKASIKDVRSFAR